MDESTPLIGNEKPTGNQPFSYVPGPVQHAPTNSENTINCQVCNSVIPLGGKESHYVLKCHNCSEATPIKGPPEGKQYVRCPCNCLLLCSTETRRVGCCRQGCRKIIILNESPTMGQRLTNQPATGRTSAAVPGSTSGGTFGTLQHSMRVKCGNCDSPFSVPVADTPSNPKLSPLISCLSGGSANSDAGLIAGRCPHCRKFTSVGPAYARVRFVTYGILALITLVIAIAVTIGTVDSAPQKKALYFLWSILYLLVLVFGAHAVVFFLMPASSIIVPVMRI